MNITNIKSLYDTYQFPGFIPKKTIYPHPVKSNAVVIPLKRIQKKRIVQLAGKLINPIMIKNHN